MVSCAIELSCGRLSEISSRLHVGYVTASMRDRMGALSVVALGYCGWQVEGRRVD